MLNYIVKLIIIVIMLIMPLASASVNQDKPLKGKWDLNPSLCWAIKDAGQLPLLQADTWQIAEDGKIYLFDRSHGSFFVFNSKGEYLFRFGEKGEGPGEYRHVFRAYLTNKKLIALAMRRLHIFNLDGTPVRSVAIPFNFPRFFIDSNRYLRIKKTDEGLSKTDHLSIFNVETKQEQLIGNVKYEKFLKSKGGGVTLKVSLPNFTGGVIPTFHKGHIYYGFNSKYTIRKIDLEGNEILSFSLEGREKKEIMHKHKRNALEAISFNGGKIPDHMMKAMIKDMPDVAPYFTKIHVEDNDYIYIFVNDLTNKSQTLDIFSPEGQYLYTAKFELPDDLIFNGEIKINKGHIYVSVEDEEGETELRKYKVTLPL